MATSGTHANHQGVSRSRAPHTAASRAWTSFISHILYGLSDWIYSLAVVVLAYQLSGRLALAAAVLLFQAAGRLVGIMIKPLNMTARLRALAVGTGIFRALLVGSLVGVTSRDHLWFAMVVAALLGISSPATEGALRALSPAVRPSIQTRYLLSRFVSRWDQVTMIAGSIAGGLAIVLWSERAAFALAALLSLTAALLLLRAPIVRAAPHIASGRSTNLQALRHVPTFGTLLLALAGGAALGIAIRVILVEIVLDRHDSTELMYGLFIALAGVGAFAGPLSVSKLLGKLPAMIVLAGLTGALAATLIATRIAEPLLILVPIIFGGGILAITVERVTETIVRRVVPDKQLDGALRLLVVVAVGGQAAALAAVVALDYLSGITLVVVGLSAASILISGLSILMYMGSRSGSLVASER